jgi:hypothetical protein
LEFMIFTLFCFIIFLPELISQGAMPIQLRYIRVYGDNESKPPILILENSNVQYKSPMGSGSLTVEFDIESSVPPNLYAKIVHCNYDWTEDENVFLNDIVMSRTSLINWTSAPRLSAYYSYRGRISIPNQQLKIKYSGNWKLLLYEYHNEEQPLAEARFFVVQQRAECRLFVYNEFYLPDLKVAPTAYNLEAAVIGLEPLFDSRLNTVVVYKNNRWNEPYIITEDSRGNRFNDLYKYTFKRMIGGFAGIEKRFRIEKIPSENEYRILDMSNTGLFPSVSGPVRLPFSDLRRTGFSYDRDDDGSMITSYIPDSYDEYLYIEFLLDPDNWISTEEVYVIGSFNGWKPDPAWQMYFDAETGYYRSRNMVRRARHNYMYMTGKYNVDTRKIQSISYEEYEGNSSITPHTFLGFVYYREFDYGGYDALIGVGAGNIYGEIRR